MTSHPRLTDPPGGTFLRSLAFRIGVRLVVLVPIDRPARYSVIDPAVEVTDIQGLESVGRHWLSTVTRSDSSRSPALELPDASVALSSILAVDGRVTGVVVAVKGAGRMWTSAERELLRFVTDYYRHTIDGWARRPWPTPHRPEDVLQVHEVPPSFAASNRSTPYEGELLLNYQPEIDLNTGRIVAVEALARWSHPDRGEVGPEEFIGLAEQTGLIRILGSWIIDHALRDFATWAAAGSRADLVLRVNVSPVQIMEDDIAGRFRTALAEYGLRGEQICVEITENVMVGNAEQMNGALHQLKAQGIRIAIDDLGIGYSTLARLRSLPVDAAKIDRSLVSGIDADWRAQSIVMSLVRLAGDLGIDLVAEGVETQVESETLRKLGCVRAQGHWFARPMSAEAIVPVLRSGRVHVAAVDKPE